MNTQREKKINSPEEEMSMKRFVKAGAQGFPSHSIAGDVSVSVSGERTRARGCWVSSLLLPEG